MRLPTSARRRTRTHGYLVQVGAAEAVVLVVELKQECVEALGGVVDAARVGRVEDGGGPPPRERHVQVTLGDLAA